MSAVDGGDGPGDHGLGDHGLGDAQVSVVMMTRDRREPVLRTLAELHALPERPPIILVDNGSRDGTAEAVAERFPGVQVIALPENRGAPARTVGVRAARTPYVAFADDDSWWSPGALPTAVKYFESYPRLALIASKILVGPAERVDPVCAVMADSPLPGRDELPGPAVLGFVSCGAIVRRDAYLAVGGFSPVIFFFGEETVLAQDLAAAGWQLAYVDDVVSHHHPQSAGVRTGRRELELRNRLLSVWLRRPLPVVVRATLPVLRAWRDPAARGALREALRRLPAVLRDRRVLPPGVEAQVRRLG